MIFLLKNFSIGSLRTGILMLVLFFGIACNGDMQVGGIEYGEDMQAHPFTLQNQFGEVVSLSDFSGDVVVLSFIYTSCDDICPLITSKLLETFQILGQVNEHVQLLVITLDPERDSIKQAYLYSLDMDMLDKWFLLVGSREDLKPIWQGYFLEVEPDNKNEAVAADEDYDVEYTTIGSSTIANDRQSIIDVYQIGHSSPVFLISKDGVLSRTFSAASVDAESIAIAVKELVER